MENVNATPIYRGPRPPSKDARPDRKNHLLLGLALGLGVLAKKSGLVLLVTFGAVFYYNLIYTQPQGRLLFPALGAIAVLMAVGLKHLSSWMKPQSARRVLFAALVCAFLAIDVIAAFRLYHFYHDQAQYAAALFAGIIARFLVIT